MRLGKLQRRILLNLAQAERLTNDDLYWRLWSIPKNRRWWSSKKPTDSQRARLCQSLRLLRKHGLVERRRFWRNEYDHVLTEAGRALVQERWAGQY